jgi:hypothetical protein
MSSVYRNGGGLAQSSQRRGLTTSGGVHILIATSPHFKE